MEKHLTEKQIEVIATAFVGTTRIGWIIGQKREIALLGTYLEKLLSHLLENQPEEYFWWMTDIHDGYLPSTSELPPVSQRFPQLLLAWQRKGNEVKPWYISKKNSDQITKGLHAIIFTALHIGHSLALMDEKKIGLIITKNE